MSKDLQAFFAQNAEQPKVIKKVISKRFKDSEGNPIPFEFKAITPNKDAELRQKCITKKPITQGSKKGQTEQEFLQARYLNLLTIESTVFPNFKDGALQDSYGVMGEEDLFNAMLTPAEVTDALQAAQEANGYELEMAEIVEEAKN